MTMLDEHPTTGGDYTAATTARRRISGLRKAMIVTMAAGATVALTGAGTFASFSASTTNDAAFSTDRMVLGNDTDDAEQCLSTQASIGGSDDVNLDINDTDCDAIFGASLKPGVEYTEVIAIQNGGDYDGVLKLFGTAPCANSAAGAGTAGSYAASPPTGQGLCDRVDMYIQEVTTAAGDTPLAGSGCEFPFAADGPALCDTTYAAATTTDELSDVPQFSTALNLGTLNKTAIRYFKIGVKMPVRTGSFDPAGDGGPWECNSTGFNTTAGAQIGAGCDNVYQNAKADLKLRWQLQAA